MPPAPRWGRASPETPSYSKCCVYSWKDVFPSPSHRCTLCCRGPAGSPHCQPCQEPPALSLAGSGDAQALCQQPTAVLVTLLSPFRPLSLELLQGRRGLRVLLEGL